MKYSKLESIICKKAADQKESAAYIGAWGDGGSGSTLSRLDDFKQSLVVKHDLRPSEFKKLYELEVGEPSEFSKEINDYKISLAKDIKL